MADNDVREMFLNCILHESVQALCDGVDLTKYFPEGFWIGGGDVQWVFVRLRTKLAKE